jgi:hypothetical protein
MIMKRIPFDLSRRKFIKTGLIFVPSTVLIHQLMPFRLEAASAIKSRTYSSVVDNRVALSNSHFARPHGISTWTTLRIATRVSITDSGASLTSTPEFAFGLCAGTTNIYKDATTDHFAGVRTSLATWTRTTTNTVLNYQTAGGAWQPLKRISTTTTTGTVIAGYGANFAVVAAANRYLMFLDILKGSPNYTFTMFILSGATFSVDATAADFLAQAPLVTPNFNYHAVTGTTTLAVDEVANGTLNAVNFYWDHSDANIEISDLAAVRIT